MVLSAAARSGGNLSLSCEFFSKFVPPGCWGLEYKCMKCDCVESDWVGSGVDAGRWSSGCWTLSLWVTEVAFAIFNSIAQPAHKWACTLCWLRWEEELHTVCFIIRLYKHPQNLSPSPAPVVLSPAALADRQLAECNMGPYSGAGAPTVGAPAIEPSWLYWIKHPVMYEAGAAPEGAELPHLLPPLCACDLLSKLCSY